MRAEGPGGQSVNEASSAVRLRFDTHASSLPLAGKDRLRTLPRRRVSKDGVLVIKAQSERGQGQNKALAAAADRGRCVAGPGGETTDEAPTYGSKQRRLHSKAIRSEVKAARRELDERGPWAAFK